ncbi:MAG TPA: ethanolamine ammonia-lyase light chain EutC, partial [Aminobacteriaceae bacterium]|nr:ethanolamine ammonia-lyase light chain EutC [Aminobacteriaceae bacterium]
MVTELELKQMVQQILVEMSGKESVAQKVGPLPVQSASSDDGDCLPDLTEIDLRKQCLVPAPADAEALMAMKLSTPARIGVWRAGPRYKTETLLRFRADHAAAQDAVFSHVSDEFLAA